MIYRYRLNHAREWTTIKDYNLHLDDLKPTDRLEIALACEHETTHVQDGIKSCLVCGEQLEVTSYRD
jgi:hypothetical protein